MAILFLGDFYYGYDDIYDDICEISNFIRENGYSVILNLEGPITEAKDKILKRGEHLRQSKRTVEVLKMLNVVGVSLANNHMMDFGEQGLRDTIEVLDSCGIQHSGAGLTIEEARIPIRYIEQGKQYTIYCMTDSYEEAVIATKTHAGCAPIEAERISINSHNLCGTSVAFLHTGFEYNTLPMPRNIEEARQLMGQGVEYVICSHPHLVQPKMILGKGVAYFSLGNFYFSEFRKEFDEKRIRKKKNGFCNTGYGILIGDTKESIAFLYSRNDNKTILRKENSITELKLKTGKNLPYVVQCWKNRNNHNPILLGNKDIDQFLLRMLDFLYWIYGLVRRGN